jgi:phospho-N-acetylmuramoyl-pentapeptide-transferase
MNYFLVLLPFVLTLLFQKPFLNFLRKLKFGQTIREDGPKSHLKKQGTPTMGGLIFITTFFISAMSFKLISGDLRISISLLGLFLFGLVGFVDDYIKVVMKRSLGLRAYQKLIMQFVFSIIMGYFLIDVAITQEIPIIGGSFNLGILYYPFIIIFYMAVTNGANLTDGLDGLLSGVSLLILPFFLSIFTDSFSLVILSFASSLLGFLYLNYSPAKVFMGDVGSMAIGGFLATLSLFSNTALWMLIVMGIYAIETISVALQVGYFKYTKKRIFKMAPIHHHFELSGWSEKKVVFAFWLFSGMFAYLGIFLKGLQ